MAAIEVHGLTKRYRDVLAVDDLSFSVDEGTVTGFLGPNGAGKTTTLRMILGLVAPTSGAATIGGRPYRDLVNPVRHVGAVLESSAFHPGRKAADHLRVLATAAGIPAARVDMVVEEVGLADVADRRVKGFSLGMRQRLGLATALLGDPRVLVLDEPANGLDPEGVHWLRRFVRSFAERGGTVLISSHLLAEVSLSVDDVVILAHGRLVAQAPLSELLTRTAPGVRIRSPQFRSLCQALEAEGIATELRNGETVVAFNTTGEAVGLIAAAAGIVIYEMSVEQFDLEEVFLDLTSTNGGAA